MAGWALSRVLDASDAQALALHKFKDGCGALAENCPPDANVAQPAEQLICNQQVASSKPAVGPRPRPPLIRQEGKRLPVEVRIVDRLTGAVDHIAQHLGERSCQDGGPHRYDIKTQHCKFCDQSYRQIRGRKPEMMG